MFVDKRVPDLLSGILRRKCFLPVYLQVQCLDFMYELNTSLEGSGSKPYWPICLLILNYIIISEIIYWVLSKNLFRTVGLLPETCRSVLAVGLLPCTVYNISNCRRVRCRPPQLVTSERYLGANLELISQHCCFLSVVTSDFPRHWFSSLLRHSVLSLSNLSRATPMCEALTKFTKPAERLCRLPGQQL